MRKTQRDGQLGLDGQTSIELGDRADAVTHEPADISVKPGRIAGLPCESEQLGDRLSGNSRCERVSDRTGVGAEPLHLGQHASLVPARPDSLGDHLEPPAPQVDGNDAGLVGRERDDAGVAAQESTGSGEVQVTSPLMRAAAAPQAIPDVGQRCLGVGVGEVDDPGGARRRAVRDHIVDW